MGFTLQALLLDLPETLESERLVLRATRAGDGERVNAAVRDSHPELKRWMPWAREVPSAEDSERYCREAQARWHARQELDFCFLSKVDGLLVGKGGLHTIDWSLPKFEIGYWVRSGFTGQGLATEAAQALLVFARERLGARRLEVTSDARNLASRRVAEKCDFVLEGIRRQGRRDCAGELADSCLYARIF